MSVPNQLVITVQKEKTDKQHLYSCINLEAIDYAAIHLRTVAPLNFGCISQKIRQAMNLIYLAQLFAPGAAYPLAPTKMLSNY